MGRLNIEGGEADDRRGDPAVDDERDVIPDGPRDREQRASRPEGTERSEVPPGPSCQTWRDADGALVIRGRVGPSANRVRLETGLPTARETGLAGYDRSHAFGAGLGLESGEGIRFAPREANRSQIARIEGLVRQLYDERSEGVNLIATAVVTTHERSLRLREIQYRLDAEHHGRTTRLFEASVMVSEDRDDPRITVSVEPNASGMSEWERFLKRRGQRDPGASP